MDVQQNTTPFPGLVLIKNNYCLRYSGSKQDLVASGLFKNTWFPGEPGNQVTISRIEGKKIYKTGFSPTEIERVEITRHDGASKLFHAKAYFLWEIVRENSRLADIPEAKKKSMDLALMWINGLPDSEHQFKRSSARYLDACNSVEDKGMLYKRGGYSMTKETVDKFNAAFAALSEVVMNGSMNFSQDDHIKARLSLSREAFNRFLAIYYAESERDKQFEIFDLDVETRRKSESFIENVNDCLGSSALAA